MLTQPVPKLLPLVQHRVQYQPAAAAPAEGASWPRHHRLLAVLCSVP